MAARNLREMRSPTTGEPFAIMTPSGPHWTGKVELIESKLEEPLHWREPRRVFVNSMSDLFHESLPDEAIDRVLAVAALCPQHTLQVLTKRKERMREYMAAAIGAGHRGDAVAALTRENFAWRWHKLGMQWAWPLPNVWLGVSVEDQATADERIPLLLQTPAAVRFVSYEPALGPVNFTPYIGHRTYRCSCGWHETQLDLNPEGRDWRCLKCLRVCQEFPALDWLIVGGESGPKARPFDLAWARSARDACRDAGVAFFMKQLGAKPYEEDENALGDGRDTVKCRDRKGGDMSEWPEGLRVRQFPDRAKAGTGR
jgi:protein gp37